MKARHKLLLEAIGGVFDEEEYAYLRITKFSWILPTIIICGGVIDLLLIVFYMKFAHPLKDILVGENTSENSNASKEIDHLRDDTSVNMAENEEPGLRSNPEILDQEYVFSPTDLIRYINGICRQI